MKKLDHVSEIYSEYDTFIIDLWGVMHDGIKLNDKAINTAENLLNNNKKIIFLSNAPRPSSHVARFLKKLKMSDSLLQNIMTSGEAAISSVKENKFGVKFFHLGPKRDNSLYVGFEKNKTEVENCDYILCTGLLENYEEDLNFHREFLKKNISKVLVCTNPDLIVHRGSQKEFCAGKIAEIFQLLGGKVVYFGKPYKEIYNMILKKNEKNLIIGDNLNTDIKGANNLNIDSVFITNGVHRSEFKEEKDLKKLFYSYKVESKYYQSNFNW